MISYRKVVPYVHEHADCVGLGIRSINSVTIIITTNEEVVLERLSGIVIGLKNKAVATRWCKQLRAEVVPCHIKNQRELVVEDYGGTLSVGRVLARVRRELGLGEVQNLVPHEEVMTMEVSVRHIRAHYAMMLLSILPAGSGKEIGDPLRSTLDYIVSGFKDGGLTRDLDNLLQYAVTRSKTCEDLRNSLDEILLDGTRHPTVVNNT